MTDEKFSDELLSDDALENIIGGALGTIYYLKKPSRTGDYFLAVKVTGTLSTKQEVSDAYEHARQVSPKDLIDGVDCKFQISAEQADSYVRMMSRLGYKFVDVDTLR